MTRHNVTITVQMEIDGENCMIDCVVTQTDMNGPVCLYCEINGDPAPGWVWDAIDAQLSSAGPIRDQYATAYMSAEGLFHGIA